MNIHITTWRSGHPIMLLPDGTFYFTRRFGKFIGLMRRTQAHCATEKPPINISRGFRLQNLWVAWDPPVTPRLLTQPQWCAQYFSTTLGQIQLIPNFSRIPAPDASAGHIKTGVSASRFVTWKEQQKLTINTQRLVHRNMKQCAR